MKKLIALISAIAVICTMSLTSFAAITVTPNGAVTGVALAPGATSGYDASYESAEVNTQTTIVAVKGTEINTSSIQYINQLEQDSETTINFDLKDTLAADEIVTVYMGGDAIDKTKIGTIACVADAPTKYTVTFKNGDTVLTTAQYDEGTTGVTYSGETPTKADDETYTYTFAGWLDSETQADVDLATLKVTKDITLIAKFTATQKPPVGGGEDEYTLTFLNADGTTFTTTTTVSGVVQLPKTDPEKAQGTAKLPYAFVGWYTDDALTTKIANATISSDTNIYPKFVSVRMIGDVTGDGKVNAMDVTYVKQARYGTISESNKLKYGIGDTVEYNYYTNNSKNILLVVGDVTGDGKVNAMDVTYVKQARYGTISAANATKYGIGQYATIVKD